MWVAGAFRLFGRFLEVKLDVISVSAGATLNIISMLFNSNKTEIMFNLYL
jgi:hypothetical protein